MDVADKRGQLIRHLEEALALSEELDDGPTGYLIERALDEARAVQFSFRKMTERFDVVSKSIGLGSADDFPCGH